MQIPFGQLAILSLTAAKNAGFAVVPLYTYNAAAKAQAAYDAGTSPGEDTGEGLPGTLSRPGDDLRLVFAVPQGNLGVQMAETALPCTLEALPSEQCPALGEGLKILITLASVIRGEAPYVEVVYQKDSEPAALRRLKPLQVFPAKRTSVARHNWPVAVLCDDIDKAEVNKTFLLSRMQSATLGLTDAEAAGIPF